MTLAQLLELLGKAPELLAQLMGIMLVLFTAIGAFGTGLEAVGARFGVRWLESLGQRIEAIFGDVPKMLRGSRATKMLRNVKDFSDEPPL